MKKYLLLASALVAANPAYAVDLTIDLTKPILTISGTQKRDCAELIDPSAPDKGCKIWKDVTVGYYIAEALAIPDRDLRGIESPRNGAWAQQFAVAKEMTLTAEMITAIKTQSAKFLDPVSAAQIWELVEPGSTKTKN